MNLKRWIAAFVFLATFPMSVFAQPTSNEGYKFYSLTVSSGDDPISSGITGIVQFTNKQNRLIEVAVQQEQAWVTYGQKFSKKSVNGLVGASVGHFQGAPWAGPILILSVPVGKIAGQQIMARTMQWPGFFAWEPRDWKNDGMQNPERLFVGILGNVGLDIGPIGLTYSKLNFLDEPWNTLPGISYTKAIQRDFSVTGSATWNSNQKKWLLYAGLTWKPER